MANEMDVENNLSQLALELKTNQLFFSEQLKNRTDVQLQTVTTIKDNLKKLAEGVATDQLYLSEELESRTNKQVEAVNDCLKHLKKAKRELLWWKIATASMAVSAAGFALTSVYYKNTYSRLRFHNV